MEDFKTIEGILDFAIAGEQEAVEFYTGLSKQTNNKYMKETFEQFAREEMGHKAKLLKVKNEGVTNQWEEKVNDMMIADYMVDLVITPDINYQDALIIAMKKEKAAFKLYLSLSEKTSNSELKGIFTGLANEEAKHKLRFELEYDEFVLREN